MVREVEARLRLSAVDRTQKAFDAVQRRLAAVEKKTTAVNRVHTALERSANGAALALGRMAAPAAAGVFAVSTIKSAAQFETALINIQKKGDLSAKALGGVKREILDIVESGKVAMSPGEIAEAYERGIAAGIPVAQMKQFVVLSAQAADAWEMTGEASGNAFAGFQQSLKLGQTELRPYADLINTLADAGISDERNIVDFIDRTGASLKGLGLSNENIAALGGTLLDLKVPAEEAATSMNALSTKLLTPDGTKASAAAFREMYGSVDKFKDLLKDDANGAVRDFLDRLSKLDNFKRTSILSDIIGQEHTPKINRLIGSLDLLDQRIALANDPSRYVGSLGKSYELKLKTLEAKWKAFSANLEKAKIDLGDLFIAPAGDFLGQATKAVNDFSHAIEGAKNIYDTLSSAVTGRAASGDFDSKGFSILDPWGYRAEMEANLQGSAASAALASSSPALGAFAARNMDGLRSGQALAYGRNVISRANSQPAPSGPSFRDAESASMAALSRQYGGLMAPSGGFAPGVTGQDLIDETDIEGIRSAFESGGNKLVTSGAEAAASISQAAGELRAAAQAIGEQGRAAAAAISSVKIAVPTARPGLPRANMAPARTMAGVNHGDIDQMVYEHDRILRGQR